MNLAWSIFALASLGPAEQEVWPMTFREAIAIALANSQSRTFAPFGRAVKGNREHRPADCPFGVEDMDGTAFFGKEASHS